MKKLIVLFAAVILAFPVWAGTPLGPSTNINSPHIPGDFTSGFYSAGAGLVDLSIAGSKVAEWSSSGMTINIPQTKNTFWSGPSSGSNANPTWRALVGADLPSASSVPLASASTVDICAAPAYPGQVIVISGNVTIASLGSTCPAWSAFIVVTTGTPQFTNSATLEMPGSVNYTSATDIPMVCMVHATPGTWFCGLPFYLSNLAFSTAGSITSQRNISAFEFTVTSGSLTPTNGFNLPATNSVGVFTNSLRACTWDASQRLLCGYTADQGGGELLQVNSGGFFNGKVTATNVLDSALSASGIVWSDGTKNLTSTAASQTQNTLYAAPSSSSGAPTFRALVAADMPAGISAALSGTTASLGGSALLAGQCSTNTTTVTGATTSMVALADPQTDPGTGAYWDAFVSSANTVTTKVCATVALTPSASVYNLRVIQ